MEIPIPSTPDSGPATEALPQRTPRCRPDDLGAPIPDDPHAISVCLPTWADVIAYEEGDVRVRSALRAGYPRFVLPPSVVATHHSMAVEHAMIFGNEAAGRRAVDYVNSHGGQARLEGYLGTGLVQLSGPESQQAAKLFWRYAGEGISSRAAADLRSGKAPFSAAGDAARLEIRQRLADWHGVPADHVRLFPSGMAAVATVHRFLCQDRPGRGVIQIDFPYVDVARVQRHLGNGLATSLSGNEARAGALATALITGYDAGVFCEIPANPLLECADLPFIAGVCRDAAVPLVADDTVASVANVALLPHADFVTSSLSKWFNGRCNLLGGAVVTRPGSPWGDGFAAFLAQDQPAPLADGDARELAVNSRGFAERMVKVNANGAAVAAWLRGHPAVEHVWFPSLEAPHPYALVARPGAGAGGLISFALKGGEPAAARFYDAMAVDKGPSLGADFSLLCPYTLLAHYDELEHARAWGVPRDLLRLSVGIENTADLLAIMEKAMDAVANS